MIKRDIEAFFTRKAGYNIKEKNEKGRLYPGVNVSGYSSLPNWTITRRLFGLPIVGEYDLKQESLPFKKVHARPDFPGRFITEVHPTLAIWVWLKEEVKSNDSLEWEYKGGNINAEQSASRVKNIINLFYKIPLIDRHQIPRELEAPEAHKNIGDKLDAFIAWLLGKLWLEKNGAVEVLGNAETGSFLLPYKEKWEEKGFLH
jgi:hypothetical protein